MKQVVMYRLQRWGPSKLKGSFKLWDSTISVNVLWMRSKRIFVFVPAANFTMSLSSSVSFHPLLMSTRGFKLRTERVTIWCLIGGVFQVIVRSCYK